MTATPANELPLVAHVIHRLDVGGMENGLVNLINHGLAERYRHAIVSLTDETAFRARITHPDVTVHTLHKKPGHDLGLHVRLWRVLRELRPDIVHTRNLATIEAVVAATLAGVPARVHGEHGRDVQDVDGTREKYRALRRVLAPLVHRFIALSSDLESYLVNRVGVSPERVTRIINGVDLDKFRPPETGRDPLPRESGLRVDGATVIGSVMRLQAVKDPLTLARAFATLVRSAGGADPGVRLVLVGSGPESESVSRTLAEAGAEHYVWLPGSRDDVPALLRTFDVFALSSRVEGISNTILEAMASGLPVVATNVGGNDELVVPDRTGALVPPESPEALAGVLRSYADDARLRRAHGNAGRERVRNDFGLEKMVRRYLEVYDGVLPRSGSTPVERDLEREEKRPCVG